MKVDELFKRLNDVEIPKKHSNLSTICNTYKFLKDRSVLIKYEDGLYIYRNKGSPRMLVDLDDYKVHVGIPIIVANDLQFKFVILSYERKFSRKKLNTILLNTTFIKEEAEPIDVVNEFGVVTDDMGREVSFEYDVTKRATEIYNRYSRPDNVDVKEKINNLNRKTIKIITLRYGNEEIKLTPLARNILGLSNSELITYSMVCEKLYSSSACSAAVQRNIFKTLYELRDYGLIDKQYALTTVKGIAVYYSSIVVENNEDR